MPEGILSNLYRESLRGGEGHAFRFGKTDFELGVGGEGQDASRNFEGSFEANFGLNFFGGLNQKSATIRMCKIHI